MNITKRLCLVIFFVAIGFLDLTCVGVSQIDKVYRAASFTAMNTVPNIRMFDEEINIIALIRMELWQHIATKNSARKREIETLINQNNNKILLALDKYPKISPDSNAGLDGPHSESRLLAEYENVQKNILYLSDSGYADEAGEFLLANQSAMTELLQMIIRKRAYSETLDKSAIENAIAVVDASDHDIIGIALITIIGFVVMGTLLARKILILLDMPSLQRG